MFDKLHIWFQEDPLLRIVVIGYPSCPYTAKALALIDQYPKLKEHSLFQPIGPNKDAFASPDQFREAFSYDGTFPVILAKTSNPSNPHETHIEFIGGADDLEQRLKEE